MQRRILKVRGWDEIYENSRTREIGDLHWVPVPIDHDGDGYTELLSLKNGVTYLGAWLTIVQVAAKCKPKRGILVRSNGNPHDPDSLSRITRVPKRIFEEAIEIFLRIGWLQLQKTNVTAIENNAVIEEIPQAVATGCDAVATVPQAAAPRARGRVDRSNKDSNISSIESIDRVLLSKPSDHKPEDLGRARSWIASYYARHNRSPDDLDDVIVGQILTACGSVDQVELLTRQLSEQRISPGDRNSWLLTVAMKRVHGIESSEVKARRAALARPRDGPAGGTEVQRRGPQRVSSGELERIFEGANT